MDGCIGIHKHNGLRYIHMLCVDERRDLKKMRGIPSLIPCQGLDWQRLVQQQGLGKLLNTAAETAEYVMIHYPSNGKTGFGVEVGPASRDWIEYNLLTKVG